MSTNYHAQIIEIDVDGVPHYFVGHDDCKLWFSPHREHAQPFFRQAPAEMVLAMLNTPGMGNWGEASFTPSDVHRGSDTGIVTECYFTPPALGWVIFAE